MRSLLAPDDAERVIDDARAAAWCAQLRRGLVWERVVPIRLLQRDKQRRRAMVSAVVVAEPARCVECGICTFNCPLGIDVRTRARLGQPVADAYCLTCGECVARCPRGTLRFESSAVFKARSAPGGG